MTCIVAVRHADGVLLAGDNASLDGNLYVHRRDKKVVRLSRTFGFGCCGSCRWGDEWLKFKPPSSRLSPDRYMLDVVAPAMHQAIKAVGDSDIYGQALVAYRGCMYFVDGKFSVSPIRGDYYALGSGEAYALGALYATPGLPPRERALIALRATSKHCQGIVGPYGFVEVARR